jgi:hypothetical protein
MPLKAPKVRPRPVPHRSTKQRSPLWKGPQEDGITFSLLSKFLECRERFRLRVVEGVVEDEGYNHALEFGSMWHECEEAHSAGKPWLPKLNEYVRKLGHRYINAAGPIKKDYELVKNTFPLYVNHWKHNAEEKSRQPVVEEVAFRVPYKLPSGRTVTLRGKWDCVLVYRLTVADAKAKEVQTLDLKAGDRVILLQENKTKGERSIDEVGMLRAVFGNLQTMLYQIALHSFTQPGSHDATFMTTTQAANLLGAVSKYPIAGGLYNVVKRPLSDKFAIRQKKQETMTQFYNRLTDVIEASSGNYFMRYKVWLSQADFDKFRTRVFDPILEQLCDWWEWIAADPFDPWHPRTAYQLNPELYHGIADAGNPRAARDQIDRENPPTRNTIHYQAPWGVYNSLASGWRGSYFEYLTMGREASLQKITTLFPELEHA